MNKRLLAIPLRLFLLHRDFVIPMLNLVASEVRENNFSNQPEGVAWIDYP